MQNNFTSLNGSIHSLFNQRFSFKHLGVLVASVLSIVCAVWLPYALFWQLDGLLSLQQAQLLGSTMFYGGIVCFVAIAVVTRFRLSKDWSLKRNVSVFSILLLVTLVFSSLLSAPVVAALTPLPSDSGPNGSSAYKFSIPFTPYEWFIGEFRDGSYYAVNGSDWNIMTIVEPWQPVAPWSSLSTNLTALTEQVLSVTPNGTIFLKQVAFDLALMNSIPPNVKVACSYQDQYCEYINSADSSGSPYTVEVGAGLNNGYYIAKDSENRICFTSTNQNTTISNVFSACNNKGTVTINQGAYNAQAIVPDGITLKIQKGATGITAYPNQTATITNTTIINENTGTNVNYGIDGVVSFSPQTTSSATTNWLPITNTSNFESFCQSIYTYQNSLLLFNRAGISHAADAGVLDMRRSLDGGVTWSIPTTLFSSAGIDVRPNGGGLAPSGAIDYFFTTNNFGTGIFTCGYIRSVDNGVTWSNFIPVMTEANNMVYWTYGNWINVPTKGLMQPVCFRTDDDAQWGIGVIWSTDDGVTWSNIQNITALTTTPKLNEWSAVYLGNGKILGIIRSEVSTDPFYQTVSTDYGTTWSTPTATNIRGQGSGQQTSPVLISDGTYVKLYFGGRGAVMMSQTYSITMLVSSVFNAPLAWSTPQTEFVKSDPSYAAVTALPDGRIFVAVANTTSTTNMVNMACRIESPLGTLQPSRSIAQHIVVGTESKNGYDGGTTNVTFANLGGSLVKEYVLTGIVRNRGATSYLYFYINNDLDKSHYMTMQFAVTGNSTTTSQTRQEPAFSYMYDNCVTTFELHIFYETSLGLVTYQCTSTYTTSGTVTSTTSMIDMTAGNYQVVAYGINSINVACGTGSLLGIGSDFTLEALTP